MKKTGTIILIIAASFFFGFAFKTMINSNRFKDVPIYIRSGKKLKQYVSEIAIVFKDTHLLRDDLKGEEPNILIYRVQPNEGIIFKMLVKSPGHTRTVEPTFMEFTYSQLHKIIPSAYERLLFDALSGDQTFFNDAPEIEAQWKFIDSIVIPAKAGNYTNKIHVYRPGSWGPKEADELIEKDGRKWIEPQ